MKVKKFKICKDPSKTCGYPFMSSDKEINSNLTITSFSEFGIHISDSTTTDFYYTLEVSDSDILKLMSGLLGQLKHKQELERYKIRQQKLDKMEKDYAENHRC